MNKTDLLRSRKPLKRSHLRTRSKKLSKEMVKYYVLRKEFLIWNPLCDICEANATEVHHKKYRGKYLNDVSTWMSVCNPCHMNRIHGDLRNARKMGWIISK